MIINLAAQWNGVELSWFLRDHEALKISGKREVFASFLWEPKKTKFTKQGKSPNLPDAFEYGPLYLETVDGSKVSGFQGYLIFMVVIEMGNRR